LVYNAEFNGVISITKRFSDYMLQNWGITDNARGLSESEAGRRSD
jgi:hypothetical protein